MIEMLEAKVVDEKVIVDGGKEFYDQGWYGKWIDEKLELDLVEAALLAERIRIQIIINDRNADFKEFFHYCSKKDPHFIARYNVYKDLRERGLPVRIGFKGSDFRVYSRGDRPDSNAEVKWIVFAESEDYPCELDKLNKAFELAENIRAVSLWAVVDNDLDVTYYIIENKVNL